ncbi:MULTISPECIES: AIR synthase family protein [unclassified Haladaptatus]|uniref:AIR synthase family protein n=1 Tax=unclassified Haladaptatus TaxID=2622732 RepID=UPI00209C486B|nr:MULTISPECIES: AIR synthase family protein [unclassified Haladaptatus]MCO8244391.1 AIR synthase family protein [Haladaptatus sp. AB643]MCO8253986.1 AIR synthase family protein [Haladaptatus sp. AB618]
MTDLGKVDSEFFEEYIFPHLGAERDDVTLGPQHGVDFGVIKVGDKAVATATDPIYIMPSLGFERAAWFAFHILMSDVAVSGLQPTHLAVDFNLPPEITDEQFATIWQTFDREANEMNVSVVTGHTARYAGCNYPMVGGATAMAVGDPDDVVRPNGARPGDRVLLTKGPAVEATGLLSNQFEDLMDLPEETVEQAKDRFYDMSPVEDARIAAEAGDVSAMHDATEGGVHGALTEMAAASGVRLDVRHDDVPVLPGVLEACEFFDIDPWSSISEGTLLLAVAPEDADDVLAAFDDAGIPAGDIGEVRDGTGVTVDGEEIEHPEVDPFWGAFEEFMEKST